MATTSLPSSRPPGRYCTPRRRTLFLAFILGALSLLLPDVLWAFPQPAPVDVQHSATDSSMEKTLMHRALDLEREAGFDVPARLYQAVDEALAQAERVLPERTSQAYRALGQRKAAKLLREVDRSLQALCPTRANASDGLISTALREGACDCDIYVVFYLSLAERTGLPLQSVLAPRHMMLRWEGECAAFFWETTSAMTRDEAFYRDWLQPAEASVAGGYYLRPLTGTEMTGYLYFLRGTRQHYLGQTEAARRDLEHALDLYPKLPNARHVLATAYAEQGNHAHAIRLFTEVLDMDPYFTKTLYRRASSYYVNRQYTQALADYDRYLALEGPDADALVGRGQALQAQGPTFYNAAMTAYNQALDLDDWAGVRVSRGSLHLLRENHRRAIKDFSKAIKLNDAQHQVYL
ncbi:MAG: tetratricopeptide repeat protein, partial [Rhodothermales bacterium]